VYNLGFFNVDGVPSFKTFTQVDILKERGHKIIAITEDEFMDYWKEKI
jgi:hypothetical protein